MDQQETFQYQGNARVLLPPDILDRLSHAAIMLYVKIWNQMAKKNVTEVWLSDHVASLFSNSEIHTVPALRKELEDAGLFKLKLGQWPAEDPKNICHRYTFADSEQSTH